MKEWDRELELEEGVCHLGVCAWAYACESEAHIRERDMRALRERDYCASVRACVRVCACVLRASSPNFRLLFKLKKLLALKARVEPRNREILKSAAIVLKH